MEIFSPHIYIKMERLNYFNPYQSKNSSHEDQLTRAYLVLLKYSFHSFSTFLSYVNSKNENEQKFEFIEFIETGWSFETQRENPYIDTNSIASILITDNELFENLQINVSERNARYDGVITFGSGLTFVIENKPRSQNVWFDQLNPSRINLSEETQIIKKPIILEWKTIVKHLNLLKSTETINGFEKIMIEDFLNFIDINFPYLNPFDSFKLCKSNTELLYRRINNILKEIAVDESLVGYHKGWGFYIKTPFDTIKKIGLILGQKENKWWLELSLYFGDTQSQAKAFYSRNPDLTLINEDSYYYPNFHLSFATSNLIWFHTEKENYTKYVEFWKSNTDLIRQHPRGQVERLINQLTVDNVIKCDEQKNKDLKEKFFDTEMSKLNICPGLGVITEIPSSFCEEEDENNVLTYYLAQQIKNGLQIVNHDFKKIINSKYHC